MTGRADAEALDAADPIAAVRARFALPRGVVYLGGNSLGALGTRTGAKVAETVEREWGDGLVSSWNDAGWWDRPLALGDRIGRLVGASAGQIAVCDSTSLNIYKAVGAALQLAPDRRVVVAERDCFPTDRYVLEGLGSTLGDLELRLAGPEPGELAAAIDDSVAAVLVNHVDYRSARRLDVRALTVRAHGHGAVAIVDLAHSAGAIEVALDDWGVDFAVGCTYKYLNGGPGSPAFIYVARRHHDHVSQPLSGWHGHARPFAFTTAYEPAPGVRRFVCGTPPIVAYAALDAALDVWDGVDVLAAFEKGQALVDLLVSLVDERCPELEVASPRDRALRGSHVALRHVHAHSIVRELATRHVVGDVREPDVVRLGLAPLYLRFTDVLVAVDALRDVLDHEPWRNSTSDPRPTVT